MQVYSLPNTSSLSEYHARQHALLYHIQTHQILYQRPLFAYSAYYGTSEKSYWQRKHSNVLQDANMDKPLNHPNLRFQLVTVLSFHLQPHPQHHVRHARGTHIAGHLSYQQYGSSNIVLMYVSQQSVLFHQNYLNHADRAPCYYIVHNLEQYDDRLLPIRQVHHCSHQQ